MLLGWCSHLCVSVVCLQFDVNARFDADVAAVKNVKYSALLGEVFSFPSNNSDPTTAT